jgi:hypothetical protein
MKKIIYLLVLGAIFVGCNPLDDIHSDIDAQDNPVIGIDAFTMTSEDYANIVEQGDDDDPDYYETFEAFSDVDDAKVMLPAFLSDKYPYWGNGSAVTVSFNLYDGNPEDVSAFTNADVYNLGADEYITNNSNAFLPSEDVEGTLENVLASQFTSPTEGQVVRLGYNQFTQEPEVGLANVYEAAFPANFANFENIDLLGAQGWTEGPDNAQGSGFDGGANANEDWLVSPQIDLGGQTDLKFQITQEIDFLGDPNLIDIVVSTDYTTGGDVTAATWTVFSFDKTIYGSMTTSEDFDFSAYDGQVIHVAFRYSSTDSDSPRWRVQSFAIKTTGVSGDTESKSAYYKYSEGDWDAIDGVYYLSSADYDSMGEGSGQPGQFNNFSGSVLPQNYLPVFLDMKYPFAQEEDEIFAIYRYYGGSAVGTVTKGNLYTFTEGNWSPNISSLQFGFEDGIWIPDNTIRYTLAGSDYSLVASALLTEPGFEDAASNLDNFGNFNRTGGGSSWSDDMMVTALGIVLDNLDSGAADGQKYIVTFDMYNGSSGTEDFNLIKEGGEWIAN